jgi:hypothetical protein
LRPTRSFDRVDVVAGADMPWRGIITFAPGAQMQPSRLARPSTDLLHGPRGFECQVSEFDD